MGRSGGRRNDRNTSGQRGNNFNTSYRDISVVVAENNSVCKAKMLINVRFQKNEKLSNSTKILFSICIFFESLISLYPQPKIRNLKFPSAVVLLVFIR